jgi:hypothetical protein
LDAATVYANVLRVTNSNSSRRGQWQPIGIVCFIEANIDEKYLTDRDYNVRYGIAPNIQYALQQVDEVIREAREILKATIQQEKDAAVN